MLNNEELNELYCSPNCVWGIKLSGMRWVWHVVNLGGRVGYTGFFGEMWGK